MNEEDQRIIDKFITLIEQYPEKTVLAYAPNDHGAMEKSLDIVIYPEWNAKDILVKPKAHGVFVTINDLGVDITLLEKTCRSPQSWPTTDIPYQRNIMKLEDGEIYGRFVNLYETVLEIQQKIKAQKTSKVIQNIIDNKFSLDNPLEKMLSEVRPINVGGHQVIIQQPDILGEDIDDYEEEEESE